jgi:type I restriction enzyme M protein
MRSRPTIIHSRLGVTLAAFEDEDDFVEKLREIHDELVELNNKAVELARRIAGNFEELLE